MYGFEKEKDGGKSRISEEKVFFWSLGVGL